MRLLSLPVSSLPIPSLPTLAAVIALVSLGGCRLDAGPDDYASQEPFRLDAALPPIDADVRDGERRLSLGIFYEGPADEVVLVDELTAHFYVYEDTFTSVPETDERVEGSQSDRLSTRGGPWWGGGVQWDATRDLSGWTSLNISVRSSDSSMGSLKLAMNAPDGNQAEVNLSSYGFAADGEWHRLEIPLADYAAGGADLTQVAAPLVFVGGAGERGDSVLVDGVFISNL